MSSLDGIPVCVISGDEGLTGQGGAVLTEVAERLQRLLQSGEEDSIDLRSLPLSPADLDWLQQRLGRGEAEITLDAGGRSVLTETAYPGVWLVTHRDLREHVVAQFIEIAPVPRILAPARVDIEKGYQRLLLDLKHEPGRRGEDEEA